jgi:hypothetical protein
LLLKKGQPLGGAKPSAADDFGIGKSAAPVAAESESSDW